MASESEDYLAYVKYEGASVEEGYLDARKSADALIGIDEVIRYFLYQSDNSFQQISFEIPVRVRKGSWETLIPHTLADWLLTAIGTAATAYAGTALKKIAENDFKDVSTKDIVKKAIKSIKWVIRIAKHVHSLVQKQFIEVDFKQEGGQVLVGIKNTEGEVLYVPQEYLELYKNCPDKLFSKLTRNVNPERKLEIGFNPSEPVDKDDTKEPVDITMADKFIFTKEDEDDEVLFPELVHNQYVELDGHVSRGNEKTNTIGFEYKGHILTCIPTQGNIKMYKTQIFTNCVLKGYVDRMDEHGRAIEKRPRIKFIDLVSVTPPGEQINMFS